MSVWWGAPTTPSPSRPTKASAPPCTSTTSGASPRCAHASAVTGPMHAPIATHRAGHFAAKSSSPTRRSSDVGCPPKPPSLPGCKASTPSQCQRVATLHPPATIAPVHMKLSQSWHSQMVAAIAHTCGSFPLSQRALGSIHSAERGPVPPTDKAGSSAPRARISAASGAERASIHSSAGRRGLPAESSASTVHEVVARQRQRMDAGSQRASAMAPRTAAPMPVHHASALCSAQPGCGYVVS
eukprot:scaffold8630_cov115-Isochrysis_galbana.AAC.9